FGFASISASGIRLAVLVVIKALTIVTLILVLLASTPLIELLKAARDLRVPGLAVHLIVLTYRYVFLIAEELSRVRTALRVRGYRNRMNRHSYRTVGSVAGTLLVRGQERAERVSQAMLSRGFDGKFRSIRSFVTRWPDVVFCLLILGTNLG